MGFMLGNLSIAEIEQRAGVRFPDDLVDFLTARHSPEASVPPGRWHCFDLPFAMVCGDMETATEVYRHLEPLSAKFAQPMQISVTK